MAQPTFSNDSLTYFLPYPQQYTETRIPRAADTISFTRYVRRMFPTYRSHYYRSISIGWDELLTDEFTIVQELWADLSAVDHGDLSLFADWLFVNPAGETLYHAILDMKEVDLQVVRFAGPTGTVLYQTHFTFLAEEED